MAEERTRYPAYDVLKEKEQWDEHTQQIVLKRLGPFEKGDFFQPEEEKLVFAIARHIVYDQRPEILHYVVHRMDKDLASLVGENQRQVGVAEAKELVRKGLKAVDKLAQKQYGSCFVEIKTEEQCNILKDLQLGKAVGWEGKSDVPQKDLFKKLATEIVSGYYSHPIVWSEIGYGGPAYPRGYVRIGLGLTDPWEAKNHDDK